MGKKRIITTNSGDGGSTKEASQKASSSKSKKTLTKGIINVISSYNNTMVSIADNNGNVVVWTSSGNMGFKGARKSTPYAAALVAKEACERAKRLGLQEASIVVRGIGPGREAAIRGIVSAGISLNSIVDDTPQPHNGVRPPKPRRV